MKDSVIRVYEEANYRADYTRVVTAAAMPIVVTLTVRLGSRYGAVATITEIRKTSVSQNSHVDTDNSLAGNVLCIPSCLRSYEPPLRGLRITMALVPHVRN